MWTLIRVLFLSIFFLTACTTVKKTPTLNEVSQQTETPTPSLISQAKQSNSSNPAQVSSWEITGGLAAKNSRKGWSASLNWLQQGSNHYQIRLFGPLGGGTVMIQNQGGMVTYTDGPKKVSSANAAQLLRQETGISLPVNDLYYWVRGIPAPGRVTSSTHDAEKHLITLNQNGYFITYSGYTRISNIDLPRKIRLSGNGVLIKLAINRWKI